MRRKIAFAALACALAGNAHAATAPAALEAPMVYTIQPRDTLVGIGARFLQRPLDYRAVQTLNKVRNPRRLRPGSSLSIPYALLKSEPMEATLVAYRGTVTVQSGAAAVPVQRGMKLSEGFSLATGPDAFLTLEFEDGSRTTLPSRSRLKIQRLRKILMTGAIDRLLLLDAGRSQTSVQPLTGPKDRFVITTPLAVAAVRGTQFRVAHDEAGGRSALEVIEGKVGSTPEMGEEVLTPAGFGLIIQPGQPSTPVALLPSPKLQNPGRTQDDPTVSFTVAPVEGAKSYRAQIASDGGFVDLIAEDVSPETTIPFAALPDDSYFVRVTAIDAGGLEGAPATYAFERRLNAFGAETPAGEGRRYRFRWNSAGSGVESFRFQLSATPEGTPLIDAPGLTDKEVVITDLPPGTYYWRVLVTRTDKGRQSQRWSMFERFELSQ